MKTFALIALLVLPAVFAHAQLDQILAPVPAGLAVAKPADLPYSQDDSAAADPAAQKHLVLTGDQIVTEVQKQLIAYFGVKGDLKLSFMNDWNPITLPGKDFILTLTDYPPNGVSSTFGVRFKISSGGATVGEWQVGFRAQLWQSVWVSTTHLDRGQSLDRSMISSQKIDVLREAQTLLSDDVDPDGYDVTQTIGPGCPISKQDVVERPVIHRGDVVDVVAVQGPLNIHMRALALEDGGLHALIRMRNLDSSKDFHAQIMNENEVTVHF
jgi:flagella basal body P-ring formation protein FlgA